MKYFISIILFSALPIAIINCQVITYGEVYEYCFTQSNYYPNDTVSCEDFFKEIIPCPFVLPDCSPSMPTNRDEITQKILRYPEEAAKYRISGIAYLNFLIGFDGEIICYEIDTELGHIFINQIENHVHEYNFLPFECNGKKYAYKEMIPLWFKCVDSGNDKKRINRRKKMN